MARAIGLRVYRISITVKGDPKKNVPLDFSALSTSFYDFVDQFIDQNSVANSVAAMERTWFFDKSSGSKKMDNFGHVSYGTYGFESNFKNNKTKKVNYRRKKNDVEEIPLFFNFFFPGGKRYGLVAFQSFQGRSCVQLVIDKMKEAFEASNSDYHLRISKMMPNDANGSIFNTAPVKRLKFIKRKSSADISDLYESDAPDPVDVELTISARRKGSLGSFRSVAGSLRHDGVLSYGGMDFDEAVAQIRVGGKLRPVGILGNNRNAGVIDVTESIVWGDDGHPTIESIRKESQEILKSFSQSIGNSLS